MNQIDPVSHQPPLHTAVMMDNMELVKLLLDNKAEVDGTDAEGKNLSVIVFYITASIP